MTVYYTKLEVFNGSYGANYYACFYKRDSTQMLGIFWATKYPYKPHRDVENLEKRLLKNISFLGSYKLELQPTEFQMQKQSIARDKYE